MKKLLALSLVVLMLLATGCTADLSDTNSTASTTTTTEATTTTTETTTTTTTTTTILPTIVTTKLDDIVITMAPTTITQATQSGEQLVWIPTRGGTKYHNNNTCSQMIEPMEVTLSYALEEGFTACKRCYG